MSKSLLFLPDISGFTEFIQNTETKHSQHVIAELLEVIIDANTENLILAEVEGDALFFYKENEIPTLDRLLKQVESIFTAFYSHLELLEKNRICPCNACLTAPNLELKIIAHCGELEFITVQSKRKPFGNEVIEAHRLMKNSIDSNNYVLFSSELAKEINLESNSSNNLFQFQEGKDFYDKKDINYLFSHINKSKLKLHPFTQAKKVQLNIEPSFSLEKEYPVSAQMLLDTITDYSQRHLWVNGVDDFEFNENEVTRNGSEHVCIINGKHLNFLTVTKEAKPGSLVYGEETIDVAIADLFYQFYIITPISENRSHLRLEGYFKARSLWKKILLQFVMKSSFRKTFKKSLDKLWNLTSKSNQDI